MDIMQSNKEIEAIIKKAEYIYFAPTTYKSLADVLLIKKYFTVADNNFKKAIEIFCDKYGIDLNKHIFQNKFGDVYIPDNYEDEDDFYTYEQLVDTIIIDWNNDKENYIQSGHQTLNDLIRYVIETLDWQFPETILNETIIYQDEKDNI